MTIIALVNFHEDEYQADEIQLVVFWNWMSTAVTSPISVVNGIKRVSTEPRLNVVWSLNQEYELYMYTFIKDSTYLSKTTVTVWSVPASVTVILPRVWVYSVPDSSVTWWW